MPLVLSLFLAACSVSASAPGENAPSGKKEVTPGDASEAPAAPKEHELLVTYSGMRNDPYRNGKSIYVRVRSETGYEKVSEGSVSNGKGTVKFVDVPEGKIVVEGFIDVDKSGRCSADDFSFRLGSTDALVQDDEVSFSVLLEGCAVSGF
jgi:hypothetical protein